jgi:hypothetical protein
MSQLPDIAVVAKEVAKRLGNIKITVVCDICQERWEAVVLELPELGLFSIGSKENPLDFAKLFFAEIFKSGHPQHPVLIAAEYTADPLHEPMQVSYSPMLASQLFPNMPERN